MDSRPKTLSLCRAAFLIAWRRAAAEGFDVRKIALQEVTVIGTYCYTHIDFMDTFAAPTTAKPSAIEQFDSGRVLAVRCRPLALRVG
jgi:hypothetical protein